MACTESIDGGDRSPAGRAVKAVLQSAGWGTTSPAKRVPKALPSEAVGRQLADYEALLPAEQDEQASAPVISPECAHHNCFLLPMFSVGLMITTCH